MSPAELVRACVDSGDSRAWEEFICRFQPLMAAVALRTCRSWGEYSPQVVDDLLQEIYLKLCADECRLLRDFQSEHPDSFLGYLKVLTANHVHDYFKSARSAKRGAGKVAESLDDAQGMAAAGESAPLERAVLIREVEICLKRICGQDAEAARDRRIFWLYFRQGLTAESIASLASIGLSTKGVESVIFRLVKQLRGELTVARAARKRGEGTASAPEGVAAAESL